MSRAAKPAGQHIADVLSRATDPTKPEPPRKYNERVRGYTNWEVTQACRAFAVELRKRGYDYRDLI